MADPPNIYVYIYIYNVNMRYPRGFSVLPRAHIQTREKDRERERLKRTEISVWTIAPHDPHREKISHEIVVLHFNIIFRGGGSGPMSRHFTILSCHRKRCLAQTHNFRYTSKTVYVPHCFPSYLTRKTVVLNPGTKI